MRLQRTVELAAVEVVAADHRPDLARAVVDGEQRALHARRLLQAAGHRRAVDRRHLELDDVAAAHELGRRATGPGVARGLDGAPPVADAHLDTRPPGAQDHRRDDVARLDGAAPPGRLPRVGVLLLLEEVVLGLAESLQLVEPAQTGVHRLVGRPLQAGVERGLDGEAALVDQLRAVARVEVLAHLLEEVRGERVALRVLAPQHDRLLLGGVGLRLRDVALVSHALQDVRAPAHGAAHVHVRAVAPGLEDPRDRRGLVEAEILRRLPEVEARGGLHAVDLVQVHLVAVQGENLALRVALLDLDGEDRLLDLPLPCPLVGQKEIPRELLRDGARAGGEAELDEVAHRRQGDPGRVQAEVLLEVGIFGGDDGVAQDRRDVVVADDHAALDGEVPDGLAVHADDPRDGARLEVVERRNARQVPRKGEQHAAHGPEHRRHDEQPDDDGLSGHANHDPSQGSLRELPIADCRLTIGDWRLAIGD